MAEALMRRDEQEELLPRRDYTMALLQRCAVRFPQERLTAIRAALSAAAAERAFAYTGGKSTTVTKKQAEAFYTSLFCQLDTVLLELHSDAAAEEALRTQDMQKLLEAGQLRTLQLYEQAKADFRSAWKLTEPFATSFFRSLTEGFEKFCTRYDARFRAYDTYVEYAYPLLGGVQITEVGILGAARYYAALRQEGELLALLDAEEIHSAMVQYAQKYLTVPEMIAENIPELMLRRYFVNRLSGKTGLAVDTQAAEGVQAEYAPQPCSALEAAMRELSDFPEYVNAQLPRIAAEMYGRMQSGTLPVWL